MKKGIISKLLTALLMVGLLFSILPSQQAQAATEVVYDAIPAALAPSYPSQPFQAQQTFEFGDYINLEGPNRRLQTISVTMVTWAYQATYPEMIDSTGWDHPITMNIYNVTPGNPNSLGTLIGTKTQTFHIPWRPAPDAANCSNVTQWYNASTDTCHNGYAFNITFDMSDLNLILPDDLVLGIAYNTGTYGVAPIGATGPYDSLNVSVVGEQTVGTDGNTDRVFWNTVTAAWYADGGASGTGTFREDSNWTPYGTIPFQITADPFPPVHNVTQGTYFDTIQAAINAAGADNTIEVAPGTYNENVTINKPGLTLKATGTAAETTINANKGFGVYILKDLGVVTIDGFTVKGWKDAGIVQGTGNRPGTTSRILNNIVIGETGDEDHGNGIQVTGDNSLIEGNTVTGAYYIGSGPYGASGIMAYAANNVIIRNNKVSGADLGISVSAGKYHNLGPITGCVVEGNEVFNTEIGITVTFAANNTTISGNFVHDNLVGLNEEFYLGEGPSGTVAEYNKVVNNDVQASVTITDSTTIPAGHIFNTSPNWWGSINGPVTGSIDGNITYAPWCGDAECTFLVNMVEPGEGLQAAIDRTPVQGVLFVPDIYSDNTPDYTTGAASGYGYRLSGQHLILADGVIIRNELGGCFEIGGEFANGDHSWIRTESPAGAKCIPTGGHAGILSLWQAVDDFVVDGLEFDGTGENSGAGIYLNAGGSNIMILNNYMHDLYSNNDPNYPSGAFEYYSTISGEFHIQGNLFKGTAGITDMGNWNTPAEYNSWGAFEVTPDMAEYGDPGVVDFDPWTHAEIKIKSTNPTGDNLLNHVFADESITYQVYGVFKNIFGADFTFTYDPAVLEIDNITPVTGFFTTVPGETSLVNTTETGKIRYQGVDDGAQPYTSYDENGTLLYTVTFKPLVDAKVTTELGIDAKTDNFAMILPWDYEYYTTNVFGILPEDVTVTVIDHPVISSDDIEDYYLVGDLQEFSVKMINPLTGVDYYPVMTKLTIPGVVGADAIESIEYLETWDVTVPGTPEWKTLQYIQGTDDVVAWYGLVGLGGFPLEADATNNIGEFRVKFKDDGVYTINAELFTMTGDVVADPYDYSADAIRLIAEEEFNLNVYDKASVDLSDEDAYYLVGDPGDATITITNPVTGYPYGNSIVFDFTIFDHVLADITSATCSYGPIVLDVKALFTETAGGDLVARLGGADGFFTVNAPNSPALPITCTTTFAADGVYEAKAEMVHIVGTEERIVASFEGETVVYTKPVISTDFAGPYQQGVEYPVVINVDNVDPDFTTDDYNLSLVLPADATVVYGPGVDDFVICTANTACIIPVTLTGEDNEVELTITFTGAGEGPVSVSLIDKTVDVGNVLATYTTEPTNVEVIANVASVTGAISMQGRTVRAGVPVTLTGPTGFAFGPYTANSTTVIGTNLFFTNLPSSTYTITTNQPRYLNIPASLAKTIDISQYTSINLLRLLAGDANGDYAINEGDTSIVGFGYIDGLAAAPNADINFDGAVTIHDLTLVAGNYLVNAEGAYGGTAWTPAP